MNLSSEESWRKMKEYLNKTAEFKKIKDSLLASCDSKVVAADIVLPKCRMKNGFGATMLNNLVFEFFSDYRIYYAYDLATVQSGGLPGRLPGQKISDR